MKLNETKPLVISVDFLDDGISYTSRVILAKNSM